MSILIKGIDAPEYGFVSIRLYNDRAEYEFHDNEYMDLEIEEVPESHGRLIDADKFKKMAKKDCEDCKTPNSEECLMCSEPAIEAIADLQPTVIKAEE